MDALAQFTPPVVSLLLTLGFGLWLGLRGKPYNGLLFNIHKLVALMAVVLFVFHLYQTLQTLSVPALVIGLLGLAALCVVALFTTGALMSIGVARYPLWRAVHIVAPFLLVASLAGMVYGLAGSLL